MSSTDYNTAGLIRQDQVSAKDESRQTEMQKIRIDRGLQDAVDLNGKPYLEPTGDLQTLHSAEERQAALARFEADEEQRRGWKKGTVNNDFTPVGEITKALNHSSKQNVEAAKEDHRKLPPIKGDTDILKGESTSQVMDEWKAHNQEYLDKISAYNKNPDKMNFEEAERALQTQEKFLNEARTRSDIPDDQKKVMGDRLDWLEKEGAKYGFNTEGKDIPGQNRGQNAQDRHLDGQLPDQAKAAMGVEAKLPHQPKETSAAAAERGAREARAEMPKIDMPELHAVKEQMKSGPITEKNQTAETARELRAFAAKFDIKGAEGEGKLSAAQIAALDKALEGGKGKGQLGADALNKAEVMEKFSAPATPKVAKAGNQHGLG